MTQNVFVIYYLNVLRSDLLNYDLILAAQLFLKTELSFGHMNNNFESTFNEIIFS